MQRKLNMSRFKYPWPHVAPAHPDSFTEEEKQWLAEDYKTFMVNSASEKIKGHNLANGAS